MKPIITWVVVADGARARVFEHRGPGKGLSQVIEESVDAARAKSGELGADRPGRVHDRMGPGRHAMKPRADSQNLEKTNFARRVAQLLDEATRKRAFDRLVFVASAKMLGDLRAAVGAQTKTLVVAELAKDLTHVPADKLPSHLESVMVV